MSTSDHIRDANVSLRRRSDETPEQFAGRLYEDQRIVKGQNAGYDLPLWEALPPAVQKEWIALAIKRTDAQLVNQDF